MKIHHRHKTSVHKILLKCDSLVKITIPVCLFFFFFLYGSHLSPWALLVYFFDTITSDPPKSTQFS